MTDTQQPTLAERLKLHRDWTTEHCPNSLYVPVPLDLCDELLRTQSQPASGEVGEGLREIADAYKNWNPDASYASSALYEASRKAADMLERLAGPVQGEGVDQVEVVAVALLQSKIARKKPGYGHLPASFRAPFPADYEDARAALAAMQPPPLDTKEG